MECSLFICNDEKLDAQVLCKMKGAYWIMDKQMTTKELFEKIQDI